jgi:hypothetical protein
MARDFRNQLPCREIVVPTSLELSSAFIVARSSLSSRDGTSLDPHGARFPLTPELAYWAWDRHCCLVLIEDLCIHTVRDCCSLDLPSRDQARPPISIRHILIMPRAQLTGWNLGAALMAVYMRQRDTTFFQVQIRDLLERKRIRSVWPFFMLDFMLHTAHNQFS